MLVIGNKKSIHFLLIHASLGPSELKHVCVSKIINIFFSENDFVAWPAPSHYLKQYWNIVNWTHGYELHWNFNRDLYIFISENVFQNVVCKMTSISSRPLWVRAWHEIHPIRCAIWGRADSRFGSNQWETALLCSNVSHWLGANLESALWGTKEKANQYSLRFVIEQSISGIDE